MPTDPTIAESDTARSDSHARAPGPRNGQARWFGVRRRLRPLDRAAAGRALVVVLVVAIGCWYFGLDPWHAILIGTACALAWVAVYGPSGREVASAGWRSGGPSRQGGRSDVAILSSALRARFGRVHGPAVARVQQLARHRLAAERLNLMDPADRQKIEQRIGPGTYAVLVHGERRPPSLRVLEHCLDVLDGLDPASSSTPPSRHEP